MPVDHGIVYGKCVRRRVGYRALCVEDVGEMVPLGGKGVYIVEDACGECSLLGMNEMRE